jgi:hypothetical protein
MNISRYTNIDKFVNIQYIFLLARRAYSWLFQLAQMWKLLAPIFLTPDIYVLKWYINQSQDSSIKRFIISPFKYKW